MLALYRQSSRAPFLRPTTLKSPLRLPSSSTTRGAIRGIASGARPEPPKLRYIVAIAILSSVTFAVSVRTLDKKAPITEMSAVEYENNKKRNILRYKRTAFKPGETFVVLDPNGLYSDKHPEGYVYINVDETLAITDPEINKYSHVVESFKKDQLPLPTVTKQAIIQDAMKYQLSRGNNRFIIGGDSSGMQLNDMIKFEQDVAPVDVFLANDKAASRSDVEKYFAAVGKLKAKL